MDLFMPEFSNIDSFGQYIQMLDDKEIQSWKSKDWVDIFSICSKSLYAPDSLKKINKYYTKQKKDKVAKLEEEKKQLEEKLKKCEEMKAKATGKEFLKDCDSMAEKITKEIENKVKNIEQETKVIETLGGDKADEYIKDQRLGDIYIKEKHPEIFYKLYSNYRLDSKIKSFMVKIGKDIAQQLAQKEKMETSALALNMTIRKKYAEEISSTVFSYCFPYVSAEDAKSAQQDIDIYRNMDASGENGYNMIKISNGRRDHFLRTIVHECLHAYGQTDSQFASPVYWNASILPEGYREKGEEKESPEVTDFFRVLRWNCNRFYVKTNSNSDVEERELQYKAYKHQPLEKHVNFIATIVEHTYRQLMEERSERNSIDLYNNYTKDILEEPAETKHNGDAVTHKYKITNTLTLQKVEDTFAALDPLLRKEMNIREEDGHILYDVPETWSARCKFKAFLEKMDTDEGKTAKAHIFAQEIARRKSKNK